MRLRLVAALAAVSFCALILSLQLRTAAETRPRNEPLARLELGNESVYWQPLSRYERLTLVVNGRQGTVHRSEFFPGDLVFFPLYDAEGDPLADGFYTWQLVAESSNSEASKSARSRRQRGYFLVQGGFTADAEPSPGDLPLDTVSPIDDQILRGRTCIGSDCVDGESFPPGNGLLKLKGQSTVLFFEDSSPAQFFTNDWQIIANDGAELFSIDDVDGGTRPVTIEAGTQDDALYLSNSDRVGMGTATPEKSLHILDPNEAAIRLDSTGGMRFDLSVVSSGLAIDHVGGNSQIFKVDAGAPTGSMRIRGDGDVGLGTSNPAASLHVRRTSGDARVLVQEQSGTTANRTLFELQNNGAPRFVLRNTNSGVSWNFSLNSLGYFQIDNPGILGGPEILVLNTGAIRMGPGGVQNFLLDPAGNLRIAGNLSANGMIYPSDRSLKKGVAPIDSREVLNKLASLPISRWTFKSDSASIPHIGPMAQDFFERFGVGEDERHISLTDMTGVALAAIQGLEQLLREKDRGLADQQAEIEDLKSRLSRLESLEAEVARIKALLNAEKAGLRLSKTK